MNYGYQQTTQSCTTENEFGSPGLVCFGEVSNFVGNYIHILTLFSTVFDKKTVSEGVKAVCKLKFSKFWPYQTDFRSKMIFWAEPRAFKVEWVANFGFSKSWILYFYLKILPQIKDSIPSFLTQHLDWPVSVHMQKKWGEFDQKWPS